ncbi:diguanylate cyclase [Pseudomonas sp. NY5710]|nr:diguanylate cyclase [Pseudomonas sp. NY5710]
MGAGVPANTGEAGARHRVACFAGKPAPTMNRAGFSNLEKGRCASR